jgi:hypothetical protein
MLALRAEIWIKILTIKIKSANEKKRDTKTYSELGLSMVVAIISL